MESREIFGSAIINYLLLGLDPSSSGNDSGAIDSMKESFDLSVMDLNDAETIVDFSTHQMSAVGLFLGCVPRKNPLIQLPLECPACRAANQQIEFLLSPDACGQFPAVTSNVLLCPYVVVIQCGTYQ